MRLAAAVFLAIAPAACAEDMAHFAGLARVTCASGPVVYAAVVSQDLPDPTFENRWRLLLVPDGPPACVVEQRLERLWIRTSATSRGSYTIDVPGLGLFEVLPGAQELREAFRRAAPGSETRFKKAVTLRRVGDALELLIEEPR